MRPADLVRAAARPLAGRADDYAALLDWIGDARVVLLGEAIHGTHEFYRERARITRLLIEERQFDAVVHLDETRAVGPLERTAGWEAGELPETYPSAV